jgi:hypothetical protein
MRRVRVGYKGRGNGTSGTGKGKMVRAVVEALRAVVVLASLTKPNP